MESRPQLARSTSKVRFSEDDYVEENRQQTSPRQHEAPSTSAPSLTRPLMIHRGVRTDTPDSYIEVQGITQPQPFATSAEHHRGVLVIAEGGGWHSTQLPNQMQNAVPFLNQSQWAKETANHELPPDRLATFAPGMAYTDPARPQPPSMFNEQALNPFVQMPAPAAVHSSYSPNLDFSLVPPPQTHVTEPPRRHIQPVHQDSGSDSTLYDEEAGWQEKLPKVVVKHTPDPASKPIQSRNSPLKPALRRSTTQDSIQQDSAQRAVAMVNSLKHRATNDPGLHQRKAGVLSNLLQLYDPGDNRMNRQTSRSSAGGESVAQSRTSSVDPSLQPPSGWWQPGDRCRRRAGSESSMATTINPWELDEDDPRLRKMLEAQSKDKDKPPSYRKNRWSMSEASISSTTFGDQDDRKVNEKKQKKGWGRRRSSLSEAAILSVMNGNDPPNDSGKVKEKIKITSQVADLLQRQGLVLKLAKALMTFGAPSHRLESQLNATARALNVDAQFIHLPGIVIASFGDLDTHTSETQFIKAKGSLNLGALHRVHELYRQICHSEVTVLEAITEVSRVLKSPPSYPEWLLILVASLSAGIIAPLGFGGTLLDACISAVFGAILSFLQLHVAARSAMYSNIFEISCATLVSFAARGLSQTNYFCYQTLTSAGVVAVLPGYVILCGSLELASRNLMSGSVKLVYAIIYSLFLGFGISIGSDFYLLLDHGAKRRLLNKATSGVVAITGTFQAGNATEGEMSNWTGTFSFTNATVADGPADLTKTSVHCAIPPDYPWWRQSFSPWWQFLLVPAFAMLLSISNLSRIRSREFPVMVVIGCVGWATNTAANKYIFNRSDVVSFIGSFVIGVLGNMYSRILRGTAFTAMTTGVLFLVPAGISAAGGLGTTSIDADGDNYSNGLVIGLRMVQVAIGITVGLFFSSFLVYSIGTSKKGTAVFAF